MKKTNVTIFTSFTDTVLDFLSGKISIAELCDPNAYFLFNCAKSHVLFKDSNLIGSEAAWIVPYAERSKVLASVAYGYNAIDINSLPEQFHALCNCFNAAIAKARDERRAFFAK